MERKICQEIGVQIKKIVQNHKDGAMDYPHEMEEEKEYIYDLYAELERYANVLINDEFPLRDFKTERF